MQKNSADWHRADIVAALKKKGWSIAALSREVGLSSNTLKTALEMPYLKGEQIIAKVIGVPAEQIWPSRYARRKFQPILPDSLISSR
ncbi:MAG: helix-turn-helix domain-containing protein [Snodgrassella sp.]|uniref:helix-turn-helix domain-containing protein n=1 Tax=Snodgrassella sp. TaxID=2815304 RepID=UPI00258B3BD2|nr:helix-turn-helix domain-containing protein [Snodgrassella sp.]MCO6514807.1 helix-turn-helix domain-containing protein [Snodgrassella sp.]MCO6520876.1 helix-turn-helix domain-containing protein [Snodgrassella sp.]